MKNERGIVLVLSLLMLTALSVLGLSFLSIALLEHNMSTNYKDHVQAFYTADGGLEMSKQVLKTTGDWTTLDGATGDCSTLPGSCAYSIEVSKPDLAIVTATAKVRLTRSTVRAAYSKYEFPFPPGGITSFGSGALAFSGNAFEIDGNNWVPPTDDGSVLEYQDNTACGAVTVPKFGVAVSDVSAQLMVRNGLTAPQQDNVIGDEPNPPWAPPSPTPSIGVDIFLTDEEILILADKLMSIADTTYAPGTVLAEENLGDQAGPKIVAVDGTGYAGDPAFTFKASTGAGILIVKNGTLRLAGNTKWTGLVLLVGENAKLDMAGGGEKAVYGSVVIVETLNPSSIIAAGGGNLKVRYSCDGLDVANFAAGQLRASQLWWTEVR